MKTRSTICLPCWKRAGLTLVEVVAAIVILGTILVGIVLAKARHTRQLALAMQQQTAVQAADELLTGWWAVKQGVPVEARGQLDTTPAMIWQTHVVANPEAQQLGSRVVQLQVRLQPGLETGRTGEDANQPLVAVDLVLPDPAYEAQRKQQELDRQRERELRLQERLRGLRSNGR